MRNLPVCFQKLLIPRDWPRGLEGDKGVGGMGIPGII